MSGENRTAHVGKDQEIKQDGERGVGARRRIEVKEGRNGKEEERSRRQREQQREGRGRGSREQGPRQGETWPTFPE